MRTMPCLVVLGAVLATGCASGGVPVNPDTAPRAVPTATPVTVEGASDVAGVMIRPEGGEATERLAAATPAVWQALLRAYATLGLTVTQVDTAALTVQAGNQRLRRVGGKSVGDLFYCAGAYENLAASGRVMGTLTTRLVPYTDGSTEVRTLVQATVSRSTGGDPLRCPSTGKLEQLIHARIHQELGDTIRR